jgi:hypothetical protein
MDIETLLRQCDPARDVVVPSPDSVEGRSIRLEGMSRADTPKDRYADRRRPHRTMHLPLAVLFVLAVVIVLLVTLWPDPLGQTSSKAAAALSRLAATAGAKEPTGLGVGQYFYTEIETPTNDIGVGTSSESGYQEYLLGTVQTWVAADGSGRQVTTTDPTPRFFSRADKEAWVAAGSPPAFVPPNQLSSVQRFGPGSASEVNGPIPLYDVSQLPTDPVVLAEVLGNENTGDTSLGTMPTGIKSLDFVSQCDTSPCSLFERAVALLQGPDIGETPALRDALFKVLATVPGVHFLGTTTDRAGQSGLGLQMVERVPAISTTVTCGNDGVSMTEHLPARATIFRIVVDPQTTTLLSSEESIRPSSAFVPANVCGPPQVSVTTFGSNWMIILRTGVVSSETAVPTTARS